MPIKIRKTYTNGQNREELTNVLEIGLGVTLGQASDGIPRLDVNGAGAFLDLGSIGGGGTLTPNWSDTSTNKASIASAAAFTLANPTGTQDGGTYILRITTGATAPTITWGSAYLFPGGIKPTFPGSAVCVITFVCDGSSLLGVGVSDFR